MDANQLGRRNLTPDQHTLLLGRRYNRVKKAHGGDRKSESSGQNDHLNTAESIAQQHGRRIYFKPKIIAKNLAMVDKTVFTYKYYALKIQNT